MDIDERILEFAKGITKASGGIVRIAFNEQDETTESDKEADQFLKYKEKRLGRDLKLYGFINEFMNTPILLAYMLEEILFPLKEEKWAKQSFEYLKNWGCEVNKPENKEKWMELFN